uniref:TBCD n=1 Tax=Angiostrongylus cantonensis TaxID=6313 RepID=A0A0K0D6T9_ANGCA
LKCSQSLLGDVRMLVNFVQDQHGNPYRRVALSALLDAVDKMTKVESSEIPRKDESEKSSPGSLAPPTRGDQASLRRGLFKRKEKV